MKKKINKYVVCFEKGKNIIPLGWNKSLDFAKDIAKKHGGVVYKLIKVKD